VKRSPCSNCGRTATYVERRGDEDWVYCVCHRLIAKRLYRPAKKALAGEEARG
jgi:hypothetical protein